MRYGSTHGRHIDPEVLLWVSNQGEPLLLKEGWTGPLRRVGPGRAAGSATGRGRVDGSIPSEGSGESHAHARETFATADDGLSSGPTSPRRSWGWIRHKDEGSLSHLAQGL